MAVAIVTGASRGLGLALARALSERGWDLVLDARAAGALESAADELSTAADPAGGGGKVVALAGDVADENHRAQLVDAARALGGLDLLVNNASLLGPSPQPALADYPLEILGGVYQVNVFAPLRLFQLTLPLLAESTSGGRATVINVTSDAGVEGYEGWGGYGSSKAALEQWSRVAAAEHPELRVYWVDPGDMNTRMHQEAYPGDDISDRPSPEASVPGLLALIEGDHPSGRFKTSDLATP